jgi:SagB-type dehydrogenase family enzyme
VIESRASLRQYADASLSFSELSYILWETARVKRTFKSAVFRTIPTGGATNAMETYVFVNGVEGIEKGLYLYLQNKHQLALIDADSSLEDRVNQALYQQLRGAQMVLFFTAVPYRSEYKYSFAAHKMIAMEAGHAGQNASLSAEVIDCGACCLAAYNQDLCDLLLQVDGEQEFTTYAITIGKKVE